MKFYTTFFFSIFGFITGCSTTIYRPQSLSTYQNLKVSKQSASLLPNFEVFGKVGFSDGRKGGNATLAWTQQGKNFQVRLYGPLGGGSILIDGQPGHITLVQPDGKSTVAKNPDVLVQTQLGLTIPVSGLQFWLRGIPAPGQPPLHIQRDAEQRIWEFFQQGWTISYQAYQSKKNIEFPLKLTLTNGPIRLKFIFHRWHALPSSRGSIDTFQSPPS